MKEISGTQHLSWLAVLRFDSLTSRGLRLPQGTLSQCTLSICTIFHIICRLCVKDRRYLAVSPPTIYKFPAFLRQQNPLATQILLVCHRDCGRHCIFVRRMLCITLFLIMINDLPDSLDVESSLFADDSCVFKSGKKSKLYQKMYPEKLRKNLRVV